MTKKIFLSDFLTSMVVLLISIGLITGVLFNQFEKQILQELESEATYISYAIENDEADFIDNFSGSDKRITLIDQKGNVIADTSADVNMLDNHGDRKEIKAAMTSGTGTSSRYSDTLMEKTIYFATKLHDGRILRVSTTQSSVVVVLFGLVKPLFFIIIVAFILSFLLSKRISTIIVKPINELDLDNPANNVVYDELTPLLKKMSVQKETINQQIKDARQKQEEFCLITENMSEGLLVIDSDTKVLTYNSAAVRLLEIDEDNMEGVLYINRKKGFRQVVEKPLGVTRSQTEIVFDSKSYDLIATPVFEEGKVIGAVIVIVDVTERARREQLRREFTANVSHELKTPLTSISGFAEMMKNGDVPMEIVVDFSKSIYEEAQRLIGLVSDIMKISEIDENSPQTEKTEVNLNHVAKKTVERLTGYAERKSVEISFSGEDGIILGSEKILEEIVYNLCDNAIKYNVPEGKVNVQVKNDGKSVVLYVSDTGIGIPQKDIDRIFERFYRVDKSHSKEIGGTGLGLSIVKHGAIYHNAEIKIDSNEGKGTVVTVIFEKNSL